MLSKQSGIPSAKLPDVGQALRRALTSDGRVNIGDKFAKDFPEYSQGDFYYEADNLNFQPKITLKPFEAR